MVAIKVTDPLDVQIHIASKKGYLSNKDIHLWEASYKPNAIRLLPTIA